MWGAERREALQTRFGGPFWLEAVRIYSVFAALKMKKLNWKI
jgi:hypothetical protein